uniref:N-ribosyldihydronicotinamide:quinone dehydrogenase 2 n=1 Tax=Sus scrofa TaxID=9823 RepID=A0A8D1A071_PIG
MAGKKVLIVYAHQEPRSFNGSLKDVAVAELSRQGCRVTVSDLYAMGFEPSATRKDVTGALSNPSFFNYGVESHEAYRRKALSSDIVEEQKKLQEADLVIFQFPLYWFSVPAILKGWMDRVLCQGFAFDFPGFYDDGFLKVAPGGSVWMGGSRQVPSVSFSDQGLLEHQLCAGPAARAVRGHRSRGGDIPGPLASFIQRDWERGWREHSGKAPSRPPCMGREPRWLPAGEAQLGPYTGGG